MSADRQRLKSAIQRIAKDGPEIRNLLGDGQNKGGKASSAGFGVSDAERDRICCDGSTSGSANPGVDARDPDASSQDGLASDDPARLEIGDGTLSGVTDCVTGEPICFEGGGFVPPERWDDPKSPPVAEFWEEGSYWEAPFSDLPNTGRTPAELCAMLNPESYTGVEMASNDSGNCVREINGGTLLAQAIYREYCSSNYVSVCDLPPPYEESWPSDGCTNLAIIGGKIVGTKYDPENDGSYSAPRDSIDLCDSQGNQISLAPSADGGWKTINSTSDSGYLYNSKGEKIAHIDGDEYSDPSV